MSGLSDCSARSWMGDETGEERQLDDPTSQDGLLVTKIETKGAAEL